jgi:hypothetical protein
MKRKSILALILAAIIVASISLAGCGRNYSKTNTGNNATGTPNTGTNAAGGANPGNNTVGSPNTANDATGNVNNDVKNAIESAKDNVGAAGNSLKYTATNFRDDVINAGYELRDSTNSKKNYFSGNETDYLMGNDIVRVYEYNSANDLQRDISRISKNGLTISGTDANYTRKPYFYKKDNSLIMYEGNEPAYTDLFKTMYGNTLIP